VLPALPSLPRLPRRLRPARLERWLARALRDLTALVEQAVVDSSEGGAPDVPSPHVLAARLRDQLGREPTREEMLRLLALLDGLESALCLSDGELARARAALSAYAEGLRRDAARA
jgi:hypothetical protein